MITVQKIRELATVKIEEGDNFIVDIYIKPGNKITILLDSDNAITIADCVSMSRYVESNLDRESEDFELCVMSAGLTEPFKVERQYKKNIGRQVDVLTKDGKKITGKLVSVSGEEIVIEIKSKEKNKEKKLITNNINLNFNQIKETKRVISF